MPKLTSRRGNEAQRVREQAKLNLQVVAQAESGPLPLPISWMSLSSVVERPSPLEPVFRAVDGFEGSEVVQIGSSVFSDVGQVGADEAHHFEGVGDRQAADAAKLSISQGLSLTDPAFRLDPRQGFPERIQAQDIWQGIKRWRRERKRAEPLTPPRSGMV